METGLIIGVAIEGVVGILCIILGLIIGTIVMHKAQKKYNGSWFS